MVPEISPSPPLHRGGRQRRNQFLSRALDQDLHALDDKYPRLVHQPPTLVGPSHPGLVSRRRDLLRPRCPEGRRLAAGPRRARYLVQFLALAVRHDGLAGTDRHAEEILSDHRPRHRPRHHFLLGRPHDHGRVRVHGREAVRERLFHRHHPRRRRAQDVEIARQLARPARSHREIRRRRPAVRPDAHCAAGPGHFVRRKEAAKPAAIS